MRRVVRRACRARRVGLREAAGHWSPVGAILLCSLLAGGCGEQTAPDPEPSVPRADRWGIYRLDLITEEVELVFSSPHRISSLRLDAEGRRFCFAHRLGDEDTTEEICALRVEGSGYRQLTNNAHMDVYPAWSPDGAQIAFLTLRNGTLDIFLMDTLGTEVTPLYDSGGHDADIDWGHAGIAFTRDSQIWLMASDGGSDHQVTDFDSAGVWGDALLPFGDYDPRIHPERDEIVFVRLVDDSSPHGIYEIYVIELSSGLETPLTGNAWTQGFPEWSRGGDRIAFIVAAIDDEGQYRIYLMDANGSNLRPVTPDYFPPSFLCHSALFSIDDSALFFVGEWWE